FVIQANGYLRRFVNDMVIGEDVTSLVDDETRSETSCFFGTIGLIGAAKKIEEIEWIDLSWILIAVVTITAGADGSLGCRFGADIDDRRIQVRCNLRKRVGKRHGIRDDERLSFLLARFDPTRYDGSNHNSNCEGCNNEGEIKQSLLCHDSVFYPFRRCTVGIIA